ncbi:MAG TPA: cellulase family glycosylhydrolase [Pyrinomonadaceae bacterium]|nr:cellulase family glycosylhydrolase [Pyrinomonadaceae bacterium]
MKSRLALVCLSLFLSLATCADRAPDNCPDAWAPKPHAPNVLHGLGVNIHFTDPRPGEIKMIADAGFRWVRMDFKWDATETERGRYDFSSYDRLIASLEPHNIHALLILDYGNPLYDNEAPPRNESTRQAFARWAVAAAKHFAGRGVIWEVYNEPNLATFWPVRPNVDEYVALALAVGRAFRAEVPREKLIGPATSGIDFPFLEACFKAGLLDYWTAVSVHPYRNSDPESAASDYCRLRGMIDRYRTPTRRGSERVEIPIISGEWGYSSVWRGMSDEKQGTMLAREMLTNLANDIPISIWYDWRDDGVVPNEPEHHFGTVRNSYQDGRNQVFEPKPAYRAAKTLSESFDGYAYQRRLLVGSDSDYVLVFGGGDDLRIAAWTTSSSAHRVVVPIKEGHFRITKHTGESAGSISSGPQGLELTISNAPIYLTRQSTSR